MLNNMLIILGTIILSLQSFGNQSKLLINEEDLDKKTQEMIDSVKYYNENQNYKSALHWALQAEQRTKSEYGENDKKYLNVLGLIYHCFYYLNEIDSALAYCKKAKTIALRNFGTSSQEYAESNSSLALFYYEFGDLNTAEELYLESLSIYRQLYTTDNNEVAWILTEMTTFYYQKGDIKAALQYSAEALGIRKRIYKQDHPEIAKNLNQCGLLQLESGNYSLAESFYLEALEMRMRLFDSSSSDIGESYYNLASYYYYIGDFNKSEQFFKEAIKIARKLYDPVSINIAIVLGWLGSVYMEIGNYKEAEKILNESLEIKRKIFKNDHVILVSSLNVMAKFYDEIGNYDTATVFFNEALEMSRRLFKFDSPTLSTSIHNMAFHYHKNGNFLLAEKYYNEALEMELRLSAKNNSLAVTTSNMANLYMDLGDLSKARKLLYETLNIYSNLYKKEHYSLSKSKFNLGNYYRRIAQNDSALFYYNTALEEFIDIFRDQSKFLSEIEKGDFWKQLNEFFVRYQSFVSDIHIVSPKVLEFLYNNLLFTKGILISSSEKIKNTILNKADSNCVSLYFKWNDINRFISKNSNLSYDELVRQKINIDSLAEIANSYEKELSLASAVFNKQYGFKKISWIDIQKKLGKNEAAVEITRFAYHNGETQTDSIYYAALILKSISHSKPIEFALLTNGNDLEKLHIKYYVNCIKGKLVDNNSYKQFWEQIAYKLKGIKTVYLSADGVYNQVNISTFYNPKTNKYLIDEIDINNVTSTRDLLIPDRNTNDLKNNYAVLIGNPLFNLSNSTYKNVISFNRTKQNSDFISQIDADNSLRAGIQALPGTGKEIEIISRLLSDNKWRVETFTDSMAIEENVKKINNPRVLHIATHGKFLKDIDLNYNSNATKPDIHKFKDNPLLRSFLIFSGAEKPDSLKDYSLDDGFLTAFEAQNLYLDNTDLVVLSACETGLGDIRNGEGVYGLQRSFFQAGAKILIMSLWSVNDQATQELMTDFYRLWLGGKSIKQAFRQAQVRLKANYPMPYYWGAFVLTGL